MKEFFDSNLAHIIITAILIIIYPAARLIINKLLFSYAKLVSFKERRTHLIKKILNFILGVTLVVVIIITWGVQPKNIFLALSSVFAVIGVALFAQWSLLSNISAGLILFFSLKLKIGDRIRLLDKDFPIIAEVEDVKTFYTHLCGEDNEKYVFPNNILLQKGISVISEKIGNEPDVTAQNETAG
jgi:small-conductance mechanosensitive channel